MYNFKNLIKYVLTDISADTYYVISGLIGIYFMYISGGDTALEYILSYMAGAIVSFIVIMILKYIFNWNIRTRGRSNYRNNDCNDSSDVGDSYGTRFE